MQRWIANLLKVAILAGVLFGLSSISAFAFSNLSTTGGSGTGGSASTPSLQQVTTVGHTTTNDIISSGTVSSSNLIVSGSAAARTLTLNDEISTFTIGTPLLSDSPIEITSSGPTNGHFAAIFDEQMMPTVGEVTGTTYGGNFSVSQLTGVGAFYTGAQLVGTVNSTEMSAPSVTLLAMEGMKSIMVIDSGTVVSSTGIYVPPILHFGGSITTSFGMLIDPPGFGTTQWTMGIGTGNSYIAGSLSIGAVRSSSAALEVTGAVSSTNFGTEDSSSVTSTSRYTNDAETKPTCNVYVSPTGTKFYVTETFAARVASLTSCK